MQSQPQPSPNSTTLPERRPRGRPPLTPEQRQHRLEQKQAKRKGPRKSQSATGRIQTYLSLLEEDHERMWVLAERLGVPRQQVFQRALLMLDIFTDNLKRGNEVVIRGKGMREWEESVTLEKLVKGRWS